MLSEASTTESISVDTRLAVRSMLLLLVVVGGLVVYKGAAALSKLEEVQSTGTFQADTALVLGGHTSAWFDLLARSADYLVIVGPALLFGILIAGAVRTFVSPNWIAQAFGGQPLKEQVAAGVAGVPLMLCSCCVAPVFAAMHERSRRVGPSLAVALAAPSLNPAALILTFMLFQSRIAIARLGMGLVTVFLVAPLVARLGSPRRPTAQMVRTSPATRAPRGVRDFLSSCLHVAIRTIPLIFAGVVTSMWLAERLPIGTYSTQTVRVAAVALASVIAVPLALPTFLEIPIALTLLGAGAPPGASAAILFAGSAVNLPSLITIARSTNWKVAAMLALAVALVACLGGLLVG